MENNQLIEKQTDNCIEGRLRQNLKEQQKLDLLVDKILSEANAIDDSFKEMTNIFNELTKSALQSVSEEDDPELIKYKEKIAKGTWVIGQVVKVAGSLYSLAQTYKRANDILKLKQEKANEWLPSLRKSLKSSEKCRMNAEVILRECATPLYSVNSLSSDETSFTMKRDILNRALMFCRKAMYQHSLIMFLIAESEAWLAGNHDSDFNNVDLYDVNEWIINRILYPYDEDDNNDEESSFSPELNEDVNNLIQSKTDEISGGLLMILMDEQLLSLYMTSFNPPLTLYSSLDDEECTLKEEFKRYIYENNAIKISQQLSTEEEEIEVSRFYRQILTIINTILACIVVYLACGQVDLNPVAELVVGLICCGLVIFKAMKVWARIINAFDVKFAKFYRHASFILKEMAGYEEKPAKVSEQISSTKWVFVLVVGLIVLCIFFPPITPFAILVSLFGSTEVEDDNGMDYKNVNIGGVKWMLLTFFILVGFLIYFGFIC